MSASSSERRASTAFLLVGALYFDDAASTSEARKMKLHREAQLSRFVRHVVEPLGGGGNAFALLKVLQREAAHHKLAETERNARALEALVRRVLSPVAVRVMAVDEAAVSFGNVSRQVVDCVWPCCKFYGGTRERALLHARVARWWGALQMAHAMVLSDERARGHDYDRIVLARCDMDVWSPIALPPTPRPTTPSNSKADGLPPPPQIWYTAANPPDGFWVMPRAIARHALESASHVGACGSDVRHARAQGVEFLYSYFIPCYWVRALWRELGARLVIVRGLNATFELHPAALTDPTALTTKLVHASEPADPSEMAVEYDTPGAFPEARQEFCAPWKSVERRM